MRFSILLIIILLIATYLRLTNLDIIEFKGDEARDSFVLKELVENGKIPLIGNWRSIGGNNGALAYYLLAIPFFFSFHPIAGALFVALLNIIGVFLCYKFGRDFFSERVGLIAAALFAVSPWAVIYSRKLWFSDIIVPFALIFFYSISYIIIKKRDEFIIPALASLCFLLQTHLSAISFIPVLFLIPLFRKKINIKYLSIGLFISLILFLPYLYYELNNSFENTNAMINAFSARKEKTFSFDAIDDLFVTTNNLNFDYTLGSSREFYSMYRFEMNYLELILFLLGTIFLVMTIFKMKKENSKDPRYIIVFLWLLLPMIFFLAYGEIYPHYLNLLYPVQYLIIAVVLSWLISSKTSSKIKLAVYFIIIVIALSQFLCITTLYNFIDQYGGTKGDYGIALKYNMNAMQYIVEDSKSNFTVSSGIDYNNEPGLEYKYLLELFKKDPSGPMKHYIIWDMMNNKQSADDIDYLNSLESRDFGPIRVYKDMRNQ